MSKITRDSVKSTLAAAGCMMRRDSGQWRVCRKGAGETEAYYADSLQDAQDTGLAMMAEWHRMGMVRWNAQIAQRNAFLAAQALQDAAWRESFARA